MSRRLTPLLLMILAVTTAAQTEFRGDLKRRAHLGIMLSMNADQRVVINEVMPDGTAAGAGARAGDVLLAIGDEDIVGGAALGAVMRRYRAGDEAAVKVSRGGETVALDFVFKPRPAETSDDFAILYDVVEHDGARLRSITTRPKGDGKHPAVLFIQGLQAASTEFYPGRGNTVQELVYGLTRAGFVVMRCEKSGVGDSTGEAASEVGFDYETEGFGKALAKLEGYDFVDADRIHVFGHSMGGIMAPLIAPGDRVAGIMVYGTGLRPWSEYMITNGRRQMRMAGGDYGEIEDTLREQAQVHFLTLTEKWSLERLREERPELATVAAGIFTDGAHYGTRHLRFFQELQDVNMAAAWAAVTTPVLAIRGEYDWVCSEADHRDIADIVNATRAGHGRFLALPKAFHGFDEHASMEDARANAFRGPFSQRLLKDVIEFCTPRSE